MPCTIQIWRLSRKFVLHYLCVTTRIHPTARHASYSIYQFAFITYVNSSKVIILQYYYQYHSLSKTTLNIGNHLYSKLGVHSSRSTCVVLICRQTQFSSNRRNNDGHCNSNSSQNNRECCNGLSVDKRLYPSLSQCCWCNGIETSDGSNNSKFVTVNVWHF